VDGRVVRIDPESEAVESHPVGNAPQAVSVSSAGIWTAVAPGGGSSIEPAPKLRGLETLPAGTCRKAVYGGSGRPLVGSYTEEKCEANAKVYAAAPAVIGVIGPFHSGCAVNQIRIANTAYPGPLAMVSPTNSYLGLTRRGPGVQREHPDAFYPTGIRNYARVYPADDAQGAAQALLAKRLGVRRAFVFVSDPREHYGITLAETFSEAARRLGVRLEGARSPSPGRIAIGPSPMDSRPREWTAS
jgi:hypothetical protein